MAEVDGLCAWGDGAVVQVLTCAEAPAGAGQEDGADVVVVLDLGEGVGHLFVHGGGEAVQALGSVQSQPADPLGGVEQYGLVGHAHLPDGRP